MSNPNCIEIDSAALA